MGFACESVIEAAICRRPELLDDPDFADELARLCWRYVRREPDLDGGETR